jgi:hypothetical protein
MQHSETNEDEDVVLTHRPRREIAASAERATSPRHRYASSSDNVPSQCKALHPHAQKKVSPFRHALMNITKLTSAHPSGCILPRPFSGSLLVLASVRLIHVGNLGYQRVIGVGIGEHGADRE